MSMALHLTMLPTRGQTVMLFFGFQIGAATVDLGSPELLLDQLDLSTSMESTGEGWSNGSGLVRIKVRCFYGWEVLEEALKKPAYVPNLCNGKRMSVT